MRREIGTYIGPYLEIVSGGTYQVTVKHFGCKTHGAMQYKYCPKCGEETVLVESYEIPYHYDIHNMTNGRLWQPDYMPQGHDIWLFTGDRYKFENPDLYRIDISIFEKKIVEAVDSFMIEMKEKGNLKELDEKGIKYEISFGVINYTHSIA